VWSGEEARGLFIGGLRRIGGERFFRREVAGELARLLDVRPDFAVPDDETARAAAGQLVQVKGRLGAARAVAKRGWRLAVVVMVAGRRGRARGGRRRRHWCDGSGRRSNGDVPE
jgi:hypothetical protein